MKYTRHELSTVSANMTDERFEELVEHIKAHGLMEPIALFEGSQVIDGWHRLRACQRAGVAVRTIELPDWESAVAYVLGKLARKDVSGSVRGVAITKIKAWRPTGVTSLAATATLADMAAEAHVSERTISDAKKVVEAGQEARVLEGGESVEKVANEIRAAEKEARGEEPPKLPKPKKPDPRDQLIARQHGEIEELREKLDQVVAELEAAHAKGLPETELTVKYANLVEENRVLKSQKDEWMNQCGSLKAQLKALEKRLGK